MCSIEVPHCRVWGVRGRQRTGLTRPPLGSSLPLLHVPPFHSSPLPHPPSLQGSVFLLDCRPVLSFSSCHISGAANINLASMMKKRFMAGKIGLVDLISSAEAKEQLKVGHPQSFPHSHITFLHVVAQINVCTFMVLHYKYIINVNFYMYICYLTATYTVYMSISVHCNVPTHTHTGTAIPVVLCAMCIPSTSRWIWYKLCKHCSFSSWDSPVQNSF